MREIEGKKKDCFFFDLHPILDMQSYCLLFADKYKLKGERQRKERFWCTSGCIEDIICKYVKYILNHP